MRLWVVIEGERRKEREEGERGRARRGIWRGGGCGSKGERGEGRGEGDEGRGEGDEGGGDEREGRKVHERKMENWKLMLQ